MNNRKSKRVLLNTNVLIYNGYINLSKNVINFIELIVKQNNIDVNSKLKEFDISHKLTLFINTLKELQNNKPITFTQILKNIFETLECIQQNLKDLKDAISYDNTRYFNYLRTPTYLHILEKLESNNKILNERLQFVIKIN